MDLIHSCPLFDMIKLKVLVIPVGPFPNMERYFSLLQANSKISIAELALNLSTENFRALNFVNDKSFISFDFLKYHSELESLNQWIDFQPHRQLFGIIGLVHCPSLECSLTESFTRFSHSIQKLPKVPFTRVFAFEPDESLLDNEGNIILIPNQKDGQVSFYLNTLMQDIAAFCIKTLRTLIEEIEKVTDPDASPVLGLQSNNLMKRRTYSRNHKRLGDYFLLCGFPKSAISNYLLASEGIKTDDDPLWQASVQEGLMTAHLVKAMENDSVTHGKEMMWGYKGKFKDIVTAYEKSNAYIPWLDAMIKIAYIEMLVKEGGAEAWKCYMKCFDFLHLIPSRAELVYLASVIAKKAQEVGFKRCSMFFLTKASDALSLDSSPESRYMALKGYESAIAFYGTKWERIHHVLLRNMLALAKAREPTTLVKCILNYFCTSESAIHDAESLLHELESLSQGQTRPVHIQGFEFLKYGLPVFDSIVFPVQKSSLSGSLYSLCKVEHDFSDPFIYAPFRQVAVESNPVVKSVNRNEPVVFAISFRNPFTIPIQLSELTPILRPNVGMSYEKNEFLIPTASSSLPGAHRVTLRGVPESSGMIEIVGCSVKIKGVVFDFLVNEHGKVYVAEPVKARVMRIEGECHGDMKEVHRSTAPRLSVSLARPERKSELIPLRILDGQKFDLTFKIENVDTMPIDSLHISATLLNESSQVLLVDPFYSVSLIYNESLIESSLPLCPSSFFLLSVSALVFQKCSYIRFHFPCHQESNDVGFSLTLPITFLTCLDISSIYFFESFEQKFISDSSSLISLQTTACDNDFLASFSIGNQNLVEDFIVDFSNGDAPIVLKPNDVKKICLRIPKFPFADKIQDSSLLAHTARLFNSSLSGYWQSTKSLISGSIVFKPLLFQTAELGTAYETPFILSIGSDTEIVPLGHLTTRTVSIHCHPDFGSLSLTVSICPTSEYDSYFMESPSEYHATRVEPGKKLDLPYSFVFYALGRYEFQILANATEECEFQMIRRLVFKVDQ